MKNEWFLFLPLVLAAGCGSHDLASTPTTTEASAAAVKPVAGKSGAVTGHGHPTAHGGSLNAITTCEVGHAEVKVDGDALTLWFVGGGSQTLSAERVKERSLPLTVTFQPGGEKKRLVLQPQPLDLAGEAVGNCSRFEGHAPWLADAHTFVATSFVMFKGERRPLRIEYPKGYDPD